MPITIPNILLVRPTTSIARRKPGQAKSAMVNPGPVKISATGATGSGSPLCERAVASDTYYGFNVRPNVPAGAADDEAFAVITGAIVEGFLGVTPGGLVYVDTAAAPGPEADFSGLTHTAPTVLTGRTAGDAGNINTPVEARAIGVGVTTTKIDFFAK